MEWRSSSLVCQRVFAVEKSKRQVDMDQLYRLFRVRTTLLAMFDDRGYMVTAQDRQLTFEDFKEQCGRNLGGRDMSDPSNMADIRAQLTMLSQHCDDPNDQLFVFFPEEEKVGVKPIKQYIQRMKSSSVKRAIIVVQEGLTSFAKQAIAELGKTFRIEQFAERELLINVTEHTLVPKHVVLKTEEKKALLERYHVKESQLPRIQVGDPVCRYLGVTQGQVLKIIRPSETAGRYVTYRLVV